jgi:putative heme-binding domain-containing protein
VRKFNTTLLALIVTANSTLAQPKQPSIEEYRRFAFTREGDIANGAKLFANEQFACSKCHSIDGTASKSGPDLYAVGDKFGRRDLVDAILFPSATIAPGYGAVFIETKSGAEYHGTLKNTADDSLQLMGADGKLVTIQKANISEQRGSIVSLMPDGLQNSLNLQEFTDLIEYLTTLQQPESAQAAQHGIPSHIPVLATPVAARPFFSGKFTLPRGNAETGLTALHQIPGHTNAFLVLHQKGMIWRVEKTSAGEEKSVFLDLTEEVFSDRGPNGLLNLTFHPRFHENRKYYVKYQIFEDKVVTTIVVERQFAEDFRADSGKPPRRIIKFTSVAEDHSGGCLLFGPDGFLYIIMGDTGPHNDPNGHAQNLGLLLGKLLRIDVDHPAQDKAYSIPKDNPFREVPGARPEIWAYGFRNPWRFCFDPLNGELWMADVGQDREEEIAIVRRGENHGWNVYEGFEPFSNQYRREGEKYVAPLFAYRRKYGNSLTGGYVYRGDKQSFFYGAYIFGDYTSKKIFALTKENNTLKTVREIGTITERLVSFGEDEARNIYVIGYEGTIYRLDFATTRFE